MQIGIGIEMLKLGVLPAKSQFLRRIIRSHAYLPQRLGAGNLVLSWTTSQPRTFRWGARQGVDSEEAMRLGMSWLSAADRSVFGKWASAATRK